MPHRSPKFDFHLRPNVYLQHRRWQHRQVRRIGRKVEPATVIVMTDTLAARKELAQLFDQSDACNLVAITEIADDPLALLRNLISDIVVIDLAEITLAVPHLVRQLTTASISTRVLVTAATTDQNWVAAVISAGASGCIPRTAGREALLDAVASVHKGEIQLPEAFARKLLHFRERPSLVRERPSPSPLRLSHREQSILAELSRGEAPEDICRSLGLTRTHLMLCCRNILDKLHGHNAFKAALAFRTRRPTP